MKLLMEKWKEACVIASVASACFIFYGIQADASDAKEKVSKFEETFENISQIADDLRDPKIWFQNYLVNHNISPKVAKVWASYPKEPLRDSLGVPIPGIFFLDKEVLPEMGVLSVYNGEIKKVIDTLWNFDEVK